ARVVHDRATGRRVVVRIGDVGGAVGRVDRDLEEVRQGAVAVAVQVAVEAVQADLALVDVVVARLERGPRRAAIRRLRHVRVPDVVRVVLRVRLRAGPARGAVEDCVDHAGRATRGICFYSYDDR